MTKPFRTLTMSVLGVVGVAALAYAMGTTTDYVYIKPGGGGTPPGNNTIAFENAGNIDFRAAGSVDAGGDLTLDATNDIDLIAGNGRITMNSATGIQFWDAFLPNTLGAPLSSGGTAVINAESQNEVDVTLPAGGGTATIQNPTNSHNAEQLIIRIKQGASATTLTWEGNYLFGATYTNALSGVNKTDYFVFHYNSTASKWICVFASKGF